MRKLPGILALCLLSTVVSAETVLIEADRDATLIEHPDGALANGSGPSVFAGRTSQPRDSIRRALLHFDVAGALPERAIVEHVRLTLYSSASNPATRRYRLHRVLADWGEGASASSGGGGRPAEVGDATWIHTFHDTEFWAYAGGQFVGRASSLLDVTDTGFYTWEATPRLLADVRLFHRSPQNNHGWVLIGDETESQTAKSFASRENADLALRPVLEVTYRVPGPRGDLDPASRLIERPVPGVELERK